MWMVVHGRNDPMIGKLTDVGDPHRQGIIGLWQDTVRLPNIVISADGSGMLKLWDLRRMRCLCSTHMDLSAKKDEVLFHAHSLTADPKKNKLFCLGTSALTHFSSVEEVTLIPAYDLKKQEAEKALNVTTQKACYYDSINDTVVSAVNGDVVIYEWRTGKVQSYFDNVVPPGTLITALALDRRGRRVYVGTSDGRILVLNSGIGTITFEFQQMEGEISFLLSSYPSSDALVAGCSTGVVHVFDTACHTVSPSSIFPARDRLSAAAYHTKSGMLAICNAEEVVFSCELRGAKLSGAGESEFERNEFDGKQALRLPPKLTGNKDIAELNFHTDQQLYEYMAQPRGECTAAVALTPVSGFVIADTTAHLMLMSTKPLLPTGCICARWEHYTPRSIVTGLVQNIVLTMTFIHDDEASVLITGDDQGCIVVWDLTKLLQDAEVVDPAQCESEEMPRPHRSAVNPMVKHCFLVAKSTPIVNIHYVERDEVLLCGLATGTCCILSREGARLATFIPDPKYKVAPPAGFHFQEGAVAHAHKKKRSLSGASHKLWDKMKKTVVGQRAATAGKFLELLKTAKGNARDVFNDDDEGIDDGGDDFSKGGGEAVYRVAPPTAAPPTTPRELHTMQLRMKVQPTDCDNRSNVVLPQHKPEDLSGDGEGEFDSMDAIQSDHTGAANLSSGYLDASQPQHDDPVVTREALVEHITARLTRLRQDAYRQATRGVKLGRRVAQVADVPEETPIEIPFKQLVLYPSSIAGALTVPQSAMLPYSALPYEPPHVSAEAQQRAAGKIITGVVLVDDLPKPPPTVSPFVEELDPIEEERLAALTKQMDASTKASRDRKAPAGSYLASMLEASRKRIASRPLTALPPVETPSMEQKWRIGMLPCSKEPAPTFAELLPGTDLEASTAGSGPAVDRRWSAIFGSSVDSSAPPQSRSASLGPEAKVSDDNVVPPMPTDLADLLRASAPSYPLQASPYLTPGRPPPVLTPYLFGEGLSDELPRRSQLEPRASYDSTDIPALLVPEEDVDPRMTSSKRFMRALSAMSRTNVPRLHPEFISVAQTLGARDVTEDVLPQRDVGGGQMPSRAASAGQDHRQAILTAPSQRVVGSGKGVKPLKAPSARPQRTETFQRLVQPRVSEVLASRKDQFVKDTISTPTFSVKEKGKKLSDTEIWRLSKSPHMKRTPPSMHRPGTAPVVTPVVTSAPRQVKPSPEPQHIVSQITFEDELLDTVNTHPDSEQRNAGDAEVKGEDGAGPPTPEKEDAVIAARPATAPLASIASASSLSASPSFTTGSPKKPAAGFNTLSAALNKVSTTKKHAAEGPSRVVMAPHVKRVQRPATAMDNRLDVELSAPPLAESKDIYERPQSCDPNGRSISRYRGGRIQKGTTAPPSRKQKLSESEFIVDSRRDSAKPFPKAKPHHKF